MIKTVKEYFIPVISAIIVFIVEIIFQVDKLFFNCPNINFPNMIVVKSLFLIFLCILFCFARKVFKEIKAGNYAYKRGFNIFLVYFSVMFVLILFTWPGLWAWDDIFTLEYDYKYSFHAWQHILTSIFHQIFLQLIPFPGGITLIQNFIISIMVAFITVKLENRYNIFLKNKFFDMTLKLIPFLLFPVLRFQLSGYRYALYSLFEMTFLCMLLCMFKEKKEESTAYILLFSFVCAISGTWRSESFIYLLLGIGFLVFAKFSGSLKKRISAIILSICIFGLINYFQISQIKKEHKKDYELTATISQTTTLIRNINETENAELLKKINKILNIDIIKNNPECSGMDLYWNKELVRNDFGENDYKEYLKSLFLAYVKHPKVILKERLNVWKETFLPDINKGIRDAEFILYAFREEEQERYATIFFEKKFAVINKPIFKSLRDKTVMLLCCGKRPQIRFIVHNSYFPLLCILLFLINSILRKRKAECLLISVILFKQILIMLTQPEGNFQYYFTIYITGYVIFFYTLNFKLRNFHIQNILQINSV